MAATNCGSVLNRYSFNMHSRFFTLSLMGANARPTRLNLTWIQLCTLFTEEAKANMIHISPSVVLHDLPKGAFFFGTVASGYVFRKKEKNSWIACFVEQSTKVRIELHKNCLRTWFSA